MATAGSEIAMPDNRFLLAQARIDLLAAAYSASGSSVSVCPDSESMGNGPLSDGYPSLPHWLLWALLI
jgi:hypothetical protein